MTHHWNDLDKGYNFASDLIIIRGLHAKLCTSKVARVPNVGIPGQKIIWMWPQWRVTKYTIRGKMVVSPKFRPWWVLWVQGCPWFVLTSKVFQLCTNHLVLGSYMFVWVIKAFQFFLVPFWSSNTPLYPSKCYKLRNSPDSLLFHYF